MSCDALFQSGMGSVDAPRTEERFTMRAIAARSGSYTGPMRPVKTPRLPVLLFSRYLDRANSAEALSHRRVRTTIP